ncbi:hypothetical protein Hanom_Chr12g01104381 [Helianthus anomalus]
MACYPTGYDPCQSQYTDSYVNRLNVQAALHAKPRKFHTRWRIVAEIPMEGFWLPLQDSLRKPGLSIVEDRSPWYTRSQVIEILNNELILFIHIYIYIYIYIYIFYL